MGSELEAGSDNRARFERWRVVLSDAAKEVFQLMVGEELSVPEEANPAVLSEVAGMVGLAGELCGVLTIRCSKAAAGKIACQMLGVAEAEAAAQAIDAVGEICNMVAGSFKAKIAGLEDKCMLSVPTESVATVMSFIPWRVGSGSSCRSCSMEKRCGSAWKYKTRGAVKECSDWRGSNLLLHLRFCRRSADIGKP
jgi:CheY-specific phosphatase CheX